MTLMSVFSMSLSTQLGQLWNLIAQEIHFSHYKFQSLFLLSFLFISQLNKIGQVKMTQILPLQKIELFLGHADTMKLQCCLLLPSVPSLILFFFSQIKGAILSTCLRLCFQLLLVVGLKFSLHRQKSFKSVLYFFSDCSVGVQPFTDIDNTPYINQFCFQPTLITQALKIKQVSIEQPENHK